MTKRKQILKRPHYLGFRASPEERTVIEKMAGKTHSLSDVIRAAVRTYCGGAMAIRFLNINGDLIREHKTKYDQAVIQSYFDSCSPEAQEKVRAFLDNENRKLFWLETQYGLTILIKE